MPNVYEPLVLEIEPPYIGSAFSPTVDITETSDDVTVTITDSRGEHSYTVDKTDDAIADAEAAAANANSAASAAEAKGNQAVDIATTAAQNADAKAALADAAASTATTAAQNADAKAALANTAASNADAKAVLANTAAANADAKATLADNAATSATTAAGQASTAAGNANDAATAANAAADAADAAREAIQDDLASKADNDGYYPLLGAGTSDALMSADNAVDTFAQRMSDHDGGVKIESLRGNTIVENGELVSVNIEGLKSVGFNQWDVDLIPVVQGNLQNPNNAENVHTSGYIPALPNTEYMQRHDALSKLNGQYVQFADANMVQIGNSFSFYGKTSFTFTTPASTRYVRFMWYAQSGITPSDITALNPCLNISDPLRNGTYEPYREIVRGIPASTYFPDGMRRAGSVYDELTSDKAITRIGSRAYQSGDEGNTSVITDGTTTHYALPTPVVVAIDPPLNMSYPVEQGGTESIVIPTGEQSTAPTMAVVYAYNADGVRDLSQAIIANIEGATASANYAVGSYLVHAGTLYRVTTAIATGETINPGTNCVQTTVMTELLALTA